MNIGSIIRNRGAVVSVQPGAPVPVVIETLVEHRIGAVLVLDGDRIAGVLSERDIVRCLAEQGEAALSKCASDLMTADVVTVAPDESVYEAMSNMTRRRFRHLPVVDRGRLVGIVSMGDLVKARIDEAEREAESLKDYIQHA